MKGTVRRDSVWDVGKQKEREWSGRQREWVRGAGLQRKSGGEEGGLWWMHWTHRAKYTCRCTCKYTGKHRSTET